MSSLTKLFTDIANALREKTGTTELIVAENFPSFIKSIKTPIDFVTQVEYLESTGTQYIDTLVNGTAKGTYEIKFSNMGSAVRDYEQYFGGDQNTTTPKLFNHRDYDSVMYEVNSEGKILFADSIEPHIVKVTNDGIYCDGTKVSDYTAGAWGTLSFYVFNSHGENTLISSMRLYYLKMYSDGVLVRDFVPALDNNVPCLYDKVSNKYFHNIGTGTFETGPVV